MNKTNKYSTEDPETPGTKKRSPPNQLEEEEHRIPKPPTVSPVRTRKVKTAENNMESDKEAAAAETLDAVEGSQTMDEVSNDITKENEATDATIAVDKEEA